MVAITINRYILISCHSLYDKLYTPRNICLMLVFAWSFSFSMMIPPLLEVWGHLGLDPPTFSCTILKKDGKSPKKMLFVLGFILPCVVIILSYTCIYWKVRQSQRNLQSHNSAVRPKPNSVGPQFLQRREDIRLTRLMLTIFCCFLLCFLPLMLVNVADDEIHYPTIHVMASVLAWASSVVNPFIYAGSNRQYRAAYHKLLCCVGSPGHGDTDYQTGAPAEGGGLTHSHSGSGKTFITDMFQYNAATDNVHTRPIYCKEETVNSIIKASVVFYNFTGTREGLVCEGAKNYAVNHSSHILNDDGDDGRQRLSRAQCW
ncbi:hypothetical protein B7P43_G03679 [Cryptotermes secundus]|uniref:G-protein coupled receptors family 1 profile domain-containing protein n=1 Tax=Cryptotermes secundus TaxID=105785 RepID=A0A2J7RND1_9NEOP|nr:hypothetical protein B7P43_G03679 [Cryptotermes secundus]